jgi:hypothetical protein
VVVTAATAVVVAVVAVVAAAVAAVVAIAGKSPRLAPLGHAWPRLIWALP